MSNEAELRESGIAAGKTGLKRRAKLIAANTWGSTAYYPADVLERDGARTFQAGLQMFEDHLTDDEEFSKPEGSVGTLIGKLTTDAVYEPAGEDGPGLYADVEFYPSYGDRINEIAGDVGLSVRASALTESQEMDGRYGPVLIGFLKAKSVDVVTRAGAGGKLTSIIESHAGLAGRPIEKENKLTDVTKDDLDALGASISAAFAEAIGSLKESLVPAVVETVAVVEAEAEEPVEAVEIDHTAVVEALRTNDLPAVATGAIIAELKEGKTLDEAVATQVALREAFSASSESGTVTIIKESDKATTGLKYAVSKLNG